MKTPEEKKEAAGFLTENEVKRIEFMAETLKKLAEDKAYSEANLKILQSLKSDLDIVLNTYYDRVLFLIKRNYTLD